MSDSRNDRMYTGFGLVFGAALGMIFGMMLFSELWLGSMMIGSAVGLIVGAIIDVNHTGSSSRGGGSGSRTPTA